MLILNFVQSSDLPKSSKKYIGSHLKIFFILYLLSTFSVSFTTLHLLKSVLQLKCYF